ncbi:hypothetical protein Pan14r_38670 [Crateriforma conspicua]|uniref:Uncharacterized protein n=2 Tax=Crateriforma conspicua TaxID=2527996 RepID=A0A5C5Y7A7_9PLAN|nr:hypothetical protein Pan14r_38670 [Crateriforma conspicua]
MNAPSSTGFSGIAVKSFCVGFYGVFDAFPENLRQRVTKRVQQHLFNAPCTAVPLLANRIAGTVSLSKDAHPKCEPKVTPVMSRFLNILTTPEVVRTIDPKRLLDLLAPYQQYLAGRGLNLPASTKAGTIDHEKLIHILDTPSMETPQEMLNALALINDMATEQGMDALLVAARDRGVRIQLDDETSPGDVAVQVWLADSDLLEAQHAWHTFKMPRRMECFAPAKDEDPPFLKLIGKRIDRCRSDISAWMSDHNRSDKVQLLFKELPDQIVATIRRGDPVRRIETIDRRGVRSVHLRPAAKDTVILCRSENVMLINSQLVKAREVYRRCIGELMFGNPDHFSAFNRFTFKPLIEDRQAVIVADPANGIESVRLTEIRSHPDGSQAAYVQLGADNLFTDATERGYDLTLDSTLASIKLNFGFRNDRRTRAIKLYAGNAACYTRDHLSELIEGWLENRGFLIKRTPRPKKVRGQKKPPATDTSTNRTHTTGRDDQALASA